MHFQRKPRALWALPLLPLAVLAWGLATAPTPMPRGAGSAALHARAARTVRAREPAMRRQALERFPADPWSQGDDFANAERRLVRRLSVRFDMRPGAVLEAIDADVKANPDAPEMSGFERGEVPPCMPRVFYF